MTVIAIEKAYAVDCAGSCRPGGSQVHIVARVERHWRCDCPAARRNLECRHVEEVSEYGLPPLPDRSYLPYPNCKELCGKNSVLWWEDVVTGISNEGHSNTCPNLGNPARALPRLAEVTT